MRNCATNPGGCAQHNMEDSAQLARLSIVASVLPENSHVYAAVSGHDIIGATFGRREAADF